MLLISTEKGIVVMLHITLDKTNVQNWCTHHALLYDDDDDDEGPLLSLSALLIIPERTLFVAWGGIGTFCRTVPSTVELRSRESSHVVCCVVVVVCR